MSKIKHQLSVIHRISNANIIALNSSYIKLKAKVTPILWMEPTTHLVSKSRSCWSFSFNGFASRWFILTFSMLTVHLFNLFYTFSQLDLIYEHWTLGTKLLLYNLYKSPKMLTKASWKMANSHRMWQYWKNSDFL